MSKEKRRVIRYYLQIGTIMWGDNMSRITSYGKQSITDLLGKMNQAENAINQADKTEDGKSTKKDKSKVFAGDLNLIDDPVTKKRKEAQQKALKVVKDAWDIDRSIDADIQEQRDHYDKMKTLYSEAQDEVLKINDQKKALREQHMVEPDSQEQKDLELLEKRQVCMSGKFNIELTEEEWKRCEEIDKAGLTNYQEQALELNKRSIHFREERKEAQKGMKEDVAKTLIHGICQKTHIHLIFSHSSSPPSSIFTILCSPDSKKIFRIRPFICSARTSPPVKSMFLHRPIIMPIPELSINSVSLKSKTRFFT